MSSIPGHCSARVILWCTDDTLVHQSIHYRPSRHLPRHRGSRDPYLKEPMLFNPANSSGAAKRKQNHMPDMLTVFQLKFWEWNWMDEKEPARSYHQQGQRHPTRKIPTFM